MKDYQSLRKHLAQLLIEGEAHITFQDAVKNFPIDKAGLRPGGSPHSAWELLEHLRIALEDILQFSTSKEGYVPLKWPDDYWPKSQAPRDDAEWKRSVASVEKDLAAFLKLVTDPERDLLKPFPWGDGQTLLREAFLVADHNAYHLGQLVLLRKMIE
ncbi:MAG TPA: DinB family protein [Bryobacteraceae bacterium]|nr:DinB family protein [Bryobacteraceae bacterium]